MIDVLLSFPSFEVATQVGIALNYTTVDDLDNPQIIETIQATHDMAICVIGEHFVPSVDLDEDGNQPMVGDGKWWVMVRSMQNIDFPDAITPFVVWSSVMVDSEGNPVPMPNDPAIPKRRWA